jgi:hypothetical protein
MTRRVLIAALAASIILPGTAAAQLAPGDYPAPRYRITPFVGYMTSIDRAEEWRFHSDGTTIYQTADVGVGGGETVGVQVETPLIGSFGLSAAAGFASRGRTTFAIQPTGDTRFMDGSNLIFARVGPVYHMPSEQSDFVLRRLGASAFGGIVVMHERGRGAGDFMGNGTHLGLNLGVQAELPFSRDRFAAQLGIENNMMFWNRTYLARLPYEYTGRPGQPAQTTVSTSMSHAWLLRAGLSYRMH